MSKKKKTKLEDKEDLDFVSEYETHPKRFKSVSKSEENKFVNAAKKALEAESKRITIRLSKDTLKQLKSMAVKEGLPYQTMIQSLLYKIITEQYIPRILLEDRDQKIAKMEQELLKKKNAKAS